MRTIARHWRKLSAPEKAAFVTVAGAPVAAVAGALVAAALGVLPGPSEPPTPLERLVPTKVESPKESPDDYFSQGRLFSDQGFHGRAVENFTVAIAEKPDFAEAYYERARSYIQLLDVDGAMQDVDEFVRLRPDDCRGYRLRAALYHEFHRDHAGTDVDYPKIIELCPEAAAYEFKADAHFYKGRYEEAIADYTDALKSDPEKLGALSRRAFAYDQIGEHDLATTDYNTVLELALAGERSGRFSEGFTEH